MPQSAGPNIAARPNLVFEYDTADVQNSYKGEPTTNILYAGDPQLNDIYSWTNSGTWTTNDNDTTVPKPFVPGINTSGLLIMSGTTITVGSQQIGCAYYNSLTPSTTYTISLWFMQNRAGSNQPYFRTVVNNNSLGNFNYNGDTNAANWPVNQWIKISCTATIQANETGAFLSNYIGSAVGDKVWYFGPQLEQKSHATPLALGTRSATQGLLDVSGIGTSINLSNVSFTSTAQITFDDTDDYIQVVSNGFNTVFNTQTYTIESIIYPTVDPDVSDGVIWSYDYTSHNNPYYAQHLRLGGSGGIVDEVGFYWNNGSTYYGVEVNNAIPTLNKYYHIIATFRSGYQAVYINGSLAGSNTRADTITYYNQPIWISRANFGGYFGGSIPMIKFYNTALSSTQVQQNYNQLKSRFNLI